MKNTARILVASLTVLTCVTAPAQSVPRLINYQGQLLDANGVALPTGDYDVEINLFRVETGGAPIWGPQKFNGQSGPGLGAKVPVVQGRFNLILGPTDTETNDLADVFVENSSVFLELKIGTSSPIAPRQQMLAAPYAFAAANLKGEPIVADGTLKLRGGLPWTANFWSGALFLEHADAIGWPTNSAGQAFGMGHSDGGFYMFRTASDVGTVASPALYDLIVDDAGNVGIGIGFGWPWPLTAKLEIHGGIVASGTVGIGGIFTPAFNLHVNGTAGKPGGGSWSVASDARLKRNIQPLRGVLDKLLQLRGVSFEYRDPGSIYELPGERMGLIAQEVEPVFPDWVEAGPDGMKRLTVRGFEALTIEALRQLREEKGAELQELKQSVAELKAQMSQLSGAQNPGARKGQP
jgi:hypothetical protein